MSIKKKIKDVLRNEKVIVRFIRDNSRYNGKHILAGGMHRDAGMTLTVRTKNGRVIPFLSEEEVEALSGPDRLGDISWTNNTFWRDSSLEIRLINGDVILDLTDPTDYVKWRILQTYDLLIAPSWDKRNDIATYRWVLVQNNEDADSANQELDVHIKAFELLTQYTDNAPVLEYLYYKLEGKVIASDTKKATIRGWFLDILKTKTGKFVKLAEDKLVEENALVYKAIRMGIIRKVGEAYYYGDEKLTDSPLENTADKAAEYISTVDKQAIKFEIMAKLEQ